MSSVTKRVAFRLSGFANLHRWIEGCGDRVNQMCITMSREDVEALRKRFADNGVNLHVLR